MLISSPKSIAKYISKIPYGARKSIKEMRLELVKKTSADNTCPLTTGIFLRIAIDASFEQRKEGTPNLPFWRLIDQNHPLLKKINISVKDFRSLRNSENL
tara:strand:- start:384 stop:683 length:300 start_codon:yes stop_codon:yes gene_type:complete